MARFGRFALLRAVALMITVVIAVYLTIIIANMGGELDKVREAMIEFEMYNRVARNPQYVGQPQSVIEEVVQQLISIERRRLGMDRPFLVRSFTFLSNAITLNMGNSESMYSPSGSRLVSRILVERLPRTLLLFGTAELLLFFFGLFMALVLSRRYGSVLDKLTIGLAPTSAAPGWFYGVFLIMIFAVWLRVLPSGGYVDAPPPSDTLGYAMSVLKHMVLPLTAIIIGAVFASIYSWRTFFLIYSSDDHVELARAKGLSSRAIERRYILRPTMPMIVTGFLLMIITMWMGQIVLEGIFRWTGVGSVLFAAVTANDTPLIVGVIVIFGYMLAATVFLLDFIYGILDPRIRVGPGGGKR